MITRLRVRHWLAVTFGLILLVAAWSADVTVVAPSLDPVSQLEAIRPQVAGESVSRYPIEENRTSAVPSANPNEDYGPRAPFTGRSVHPDLLSRSAVIVKIDNHPAARPQTGLQMADIVFDIRAEGVTRFAAVFHSQLPEPVGPVRSSRTSDFDILRGFDTPVYGSSGANDVVASGLRELPIVELTNRTRNEYFRDFSRPAPHNLFVNTPELLALAPDGLPRPQPWFVYRRRDEDTSSNAQPAIGPVEIAFTGSPVVTHTWDDRVRGWLRTQDGRPHLTSDGDQLAPENVVIMVTDYSVSAADVTSPEVRSTGTGELVVLTNGQIIVGSWDRPEPSDKPVLTDVDGSEIALSEGRTWVLMPEQGQVTFTEGQELSAVAGSASQFEAVQPSQN